MGRTERLMHRKTEKAEKILPNELAELRKVQNEAATALMKSQEAHMVAAECKTVVDFTVMTLRHRYNLKVGDNINPDDGKITRA